MEKTPADLKRLLATTPKAKIVWDGLTPLARYDFISWIESAKQAETRKRRVNSVPSRLMSGKRRPCCYSMVPMNLYKALGVNAKAKIAWKNLDPMERRKFVTWIEAGKNPEEHKRRIDKVCTTLGTGRKSI